MQVGRKQAQTTQLPRSPISPWAVWWLLPHFFSDLDGEDLRGPWDREHFVNQSL